MLDEKIEKVKDEVKTFLSSENSGHGFDHIERVLGLSLMFAETQGADKEKTALIALLHDVDDYKLIGNERSTELLNARNIMDKCSIDKSLQGEVISSIKTIGYSKRIKGTVPDSLEGKIVSDADMCDALGVNGFLRTYQFGLSKGRPFFVKDEFPREDITFENYINKDTGTGIGHIFEKILKLKDLMLTESGKITAEKRHKILVDMLYCFFEEENASEWIKYLDNYK